MEAPEFTSQDLTRDLLTLLGSADICSKRWIWQQYDYQVRTNTIAGPGSDAAILRVKETGESLAMSLDGNARYCYLSPREGAQLIVAECCRNLAVVGAEPVGATNNLNFGNPERPEIMAQLVEAIEGIADACRHFETPITGGNVSLYNETLGEGVWPTPVVGIVGLMKTGAPVGTHFREPGRAVMLIGSMDECEPVAIRRNAVRQGDFETALGIAAGAGYGLREARTRGGARDRARGLGGIGARPERWWAGGGSGGMFVRSEFHWRQRAVGRRGEPAHRSFPRGAVTGFDFHIRTGAGAADRRRARRRRCTNRSHNKG